MRNKPALRAQLERIVRRIIKGFHPEQIILFSSHARTHRLLLAR
jgi:hypothetical protein